MVTSIIEDRYVPAPGYAWPDGGTDFRELQDGLKGVWKAGLIHPLFPNILSGSVEGMWIPDPGYDWKSARKVAEDIFEVEWKPGQRHPKRPKLFASGEEGEWRPLPGYSWVDKRKDLSVQWTPGLVHSSLPNVIAGTKEGTWGPAQGYIWKTDLSADTIQAALEVASPQDLERYTTTVAHSAGWGRAAEIIWTVTKEVIKGAAVQKAIEATEKGIRVAKHGVERLDKDYGRGRSRREADRNNAAGERHEKAEKEGTKPAATELISLE